jgi:hypothetical protein
MPHLALGKIDKIKVSTPLSDKRDISAFIVKKTKMVLKQNQPLQYDTHVFKRLSFGESNNLRKLIKKSISGGMKPLKIKIKKVIFTLSNIPITKWNTSIQTIAITMIFD